MQLALTHHPQSEAGVVQSLTVEPGLGGGGLLALSFRLAGRLDDLLLPPAGPSLRRDGLWKHTCFEVFLRGEGAAPYFEFNFSPSTEWAAYRFSGYRDGMSPLELPKPPDISVKPSTSELVVEVTLDLGDVEGLAGSPLWHMGASAVLEAREGGLSYWALSHGDGDPDFHNPDTFAHVLKEPEIK